MTVISAFIFSENAASGEARQERIYAGNRPALSVSVGVISLYKPEYEGSDKYTKLQDGP